jgi:hypothetical protein
LRPIRASVGFATALRRGWWIAALGTLALAGGVSGLALAKTPYGVNITLKPSRVLENEPIYMEVYGIAITKTHLYVATSRRVCQTSARAEEALVYSREATKRLWTFVGPNQAGQTRFYHGEYFSVTGKGTHYACAYVYENVPEYKDLVYAQVSWHVG